MNFFANKRWYELFSPLLAGILIAASQPPSILFPIAFICLLPLFYSMEQIEARKAFLPGFVTGCVSYLLLVYWVVVAMHRFGGIPIGMSIMILLLLVLFLSLYTGCFAFTVVFLERRLGVPLWLSAPFLWVILEYLRTYLLSGFPWSLMAHSQHAFLPFIQVASITGTYFISFLIVAVNCIVYCLARRVRLPAAYIIIILALIAGSLVYGFTRPATPSGQTVTTAIIQGNIGQDVKWDAATIRKTVEVYASRTVETGRGADIILWPETAFPFALESSPEAFSLTKKLSSITGAYLLAGALSRDAFGGTYNSAYIFSKEGELLGIYSKVHLVPFGEYTPLVNYFPFLRNISVDMGGFQSGKSHNPVPTGISKIGILICYEAIFPSIAVDTVRKGAQVLVNITNDAWYGRSSAPYQHLVFSVFRAIETDRFVLRAANTGISAIINPRGKVLAQTSLFKEETLKGDFFPKDTVTFYVRYGDYFILIAALLLVCAIVIQMVKKRRSQ